MKTLFVKILIVGLLSMLIFACKKKDSDAAAPILPSNSSSQVIINGESFSAYTQIIVPNKKVLSDKKYKPPIPAGGGCFCIKDTTKYSGITIYEFGFGQTNIPVPGDTVFLGFTIASLMPITAGTYTINGKGNNAKTLTYPLATLIYGDTQNTYEDSTGTGTITISYMDLVNKVVYGTYSYKGNGTKNSSPTTLNISNGQFNNVSLQEF
jgi:hypothetical protein